jgi:hypothetical protein
MKLDRKKRKDYKGTIPYEGVGMPLIPDRKEGVTMNYGAGYVGYNFDKPKPCKHGITPPEYCDLCAVPFKRPKKCKHRNCWVINGGYGLWCYECGAYRQTTVEGVNSVVPIGRWIKPTGIGGKNPYEKLVERKIK